MPSDLPFRQVGMAVGAAGKGARRWSVDRDAYRGNCGTANPPIPLAASGRAVGADRRGGAVPDDACGHAAHNPEGQGVLLVDSRSTNPKSVAVVLNDHLVAPAAIATTGLVVRIVINSAAFGYFSLWIPPGSGAIPEPPDRNRPLAHWPTKS